MGIPYKFTTSSDDMPVLTLKECQKTGCKCGCGINPIKVYRKELSQRMEKHGLTLGKDELLPPKGFEETGELNPFRIVADLYNEKFSKGLDNCLLRKMDITDCVYGCYYGISDIEKPQPHPHQKRIFCMPKYKDSLQNMSKILAGNLIGVRFCNFEDIVMHLDKLKKEAGDKSKGYGTLAIYDTALRLAWNSSRNEEERKKLLPEKVWLQQGAMEGAKFLEKLGQLSKAPDKHPKEGLGHKWVNERKDYPAPIASLEAYHIEDLLCIFHPLFEQWAKSI